MNFTSWTLALVASLGLLASLGAQVVPPPDGGPPGWIQVDDMWLNPETAFQEGNFAGNLWSNDTVYYLFDSGITTEERSLFRKALREVEAISSLNFIEGGSSFDFIFVRRNTDSDNVSSSPVGRVGGPQNLRVGANHWDDKYVLAHEVFHALGFMHEQSRLDRNTYVSIVYPLISLTACSGSCWHNFDINSIAPVGPYDFESIMHYNDTAFTVQPGVPTILAKPAYEHMQDVMGNRAHFSFGDANLVQTFYGQPTRPTITGTNPSLVQEDGGEIIMRVGGTNFFEGSLDGEGVTGTVVTWNGTPLETTWESETVVEARVPASFLDTPGTFVVRVSNHSEAGGASTTSANFTVYAAPCGTANQKRGTSVVGTGDFDLDGVPDFAVGVPGFDGATNEQGRVELVSGRTGVITNIDFSFAASEFGTAMASLPDVNGDGRRDLLVGAPEFGSSAGGFRVLALPSGTVLASWLPSASAEDVGAAVSALGDIDNDGDQEFIIAAPAANTLRGRVEIWSMNGGIIRTHTGVNTGDRFGASVHGGHDVSGDGVPDYAIGAPTSDFNGSSAGRVYVYSGATGNLLFSRDGDAAGDNLGHSVAIVPSTTSRSGTAHTVVGAPYGNTGGTDVGYVRIFAGSQSIGSYSTIDTFSGTTAGERFGWSVGTAGDIDDDGRTEIFVGATMEGANSSGVIGAGRVQVISPSLDEVFHIEDRAIFLGPNESGSEFGHSVALIGDVDGDTHLDYVVGQPDYDGACNSIGRYRTFEVRIPPATGRVLISEVYAGTPVSVELTNYGTGSMATTGWRVVYSDATIAYSSTALDTSIPAGHRIIVKEPGGTISEAPPGTILLNNFPSIASTTGDITVALVSGTGQIIDEVRIAGSDGIYNDPGLGGKFRGYVRNVQTGTFVSVTAAERIEGLDSNSGSDWTANNGRSLGLENRNSGQRGIDTIPAYAVKINEIDDSPDYIEMVNRGQTSVNLNGWYLLASAVQGGAHAHIRPNWDSGLNTGIIGSQTYVVLGDTSTAPAEKPSGVRYIDVTTEGYPGLPFTTSEYDCALYDHYGRLVDIVRSTGHDDAVAHNHPRAPSGTTDFIGAGQRGTAGDQAFGRRIAIDNDLGTDWKPMSTRTMGSPNPVTFVSQSPLSPLDVRFHDTAQGGGLTMILNAEATNAGALWTFTFSYGHLSGTGPLLGLGSEALSIYQTLSTTPPFFGTLDSRGHARLDVDPGSIPLGVDLDAIFFLQDPTSLAYTAISYILEFDT